MLIRMDLQFRQLDSITPGHPEVGVTEGIEVTTGPLGQGTHPFSDRRRIEADSRHRLQGSPTPSDSPLRRPISARPSTRMDSPFSTTTRSTSSAFRALLTGPSYMFTGDGCLMEGMSSEAASLCGSVCPVPRPRR